MLATTYCFWTGRLAECVEEFNKVQALYDGAKHGHLVTRLNHDPRTVSGIYASLCIWLLGFPDRASRMLDETYSHARRLNHPWDLGWALMFPAISGFPFEPERVRKIGDECGQIGRDNSMPMLWAMWTPLVYGTALIREGNVIKGVDQLQTALAFWDAAAGKIWSPYGKAFLAEGIAMLGDIDAALDLIDAQIAQIERPGWEERIWYGEVLRLKGWMLSLRGDAAGAEQTWLASLDWTREQQAKSWELRTAISLARLWQAQGKRREAHDLLVPLCNWFTEGFDTKDLQDAKALIDELSD